MKLGGEMAKKATTGKAVAKTAVSKTAPAKTSKNITTLKVTPAKRSNVVNKSVQRTAARPVRRSAREQIAVFIDLDNTNASYENIQELFSVLKNQGHISYAKFFGYTDEKVDEFEEFVVENGLETLGKMRFKLEGVSVIDNRLLIECMNFCESQRPDIVFVWAGMGDLMPLYIKLRELGCKTATVDLPEFDCKNKFIDQRIKLYSKYSHSFTKFAPPAVDTFMPRAESLPRAEVTPPKTVSEPKPKSTAPKVPGFGTVPQLPRKKGAPDFGSKEESKNKEEKEEQPQSSEEEKKNDEIDAPMANFYRMAMGLIDDMKAQREREEQTAEAEDFAELKIMDDDETTVEADQQPAEANSALTEQAESKSIQDEQFFTTAMPSGFDDFASLSEIPSDPVADFEAESSVINEQLQPESVAEPESEAEQKPEIESENLAETEPPQQESVPETTVASEIDQLPEPYFETAPVQNTSESESQQTNTEEGVQGFGAAFNFGDRYEAEENESQKKNEKSAAEEYEEHETDFNKPIAFGAVPIEN